MNAERLLYFTRRLSDVEGELGIQSQLDSLVSNLETLASNPQDTGAQNSVASAMNSLSAKVLDEFYDNLTPAEQENFAEISAAPYFSGEMIDQIRSVIAENAMTPAVAVKQVRGLRDRRRGYINSLSSLLQGLEDIGIEADEPPDGEADISFVVPREIFHNNIQGLAKELSVIDRVIKAFSEAATGTPENATLRTLATSDPLITVALGFLVITQIGKSVSWLLDTWKKALEIKELRQKTKDSGGFTEKELKIFDDKIEKIVQAKISERVDQILKESKADAGRRNELRTALQWAHEALLSRIERGLSIEIRLLSPPGLADGEEPEGAQTPEAEMVRAIARTLTFPAPSGDPVLALPGPLEEADKPAPTRTSKKPPARRPTKPS